MKRINESWILPENREKYWCEKCCNYDREHEGHDGCSQCKLTGMQTFGQMFGGGCTGFNVPAQFLKDIRIKGEAPCDIKLIIKECYPFGKATEDGQNIGSSIGLKFTYFGNQYGSVRYLSEPFVSVDMLKADIPNMLRDVIYSLFTGSIKKEDDWVK
ncbi:MAG: hypothetical protein E7575_06165 [Ruminococcaceae bacterium]|nr:hypothetical protein [Oscillospiraceae bacterium]